MKTKTNYSLNIYNNFSLKTSFNLKTDISLKTSFSLDSRYKHSLALFNVKGKHFIAYNVSTPGYRTRTDSNITNNTNSQNCNTRVTISTKNHIATLVDLTNTHSNNVNTCSHYANICGHNANTNSHNANTYSHNANIYSLNTTLIVIMQALTVTMQTLTVLM